MNGCPLCDYLHGIQQKYCGEATPAALTERRKQWLRYVPREQSDRSLLNMVSAHLVTMPFGNAWAHQTTVLLCVSANEKPI